MSARLPAAAICAALAIGAAIAPSTALAARDLESTFQDDNHLIYTSLGALRETLDRLKGLGVERIRATVLWSFLAPDPRKRQRPAGFDGANPVAYPPSQWEHYDNLVREANARGMRVNFNVTGPSPLWANRPPPRPDVATTYEPSPTEFGRFVRAVGLRYSGAYPAPDGSGPLPRVGYWTVWNEPNQSGWLTPQWATVPGTKRFRPRAATLYRELLDEAWSALVATGHRSDTILIGETAPGGNDSHGVKRMMEPLEFVHALYCLDPRGHGLRGTAAADAQCRPGAPFRAAHPALFDATGYAHHPYNLLLAPNLSPRDGDHVNIASLSRLTRALDGALRAYGKRRHYKLYLTEFGYQTEPDPVAGMFVTLDRQAEWLNQSEYMAWRDARVKTLAQFLLYDDGPPLDLTFQSGLLFREGGVKPAYGAYRLPIWIVRRRGATVTVWGQARPAAAGPTGADVVRMPRRRGTRPVVLRHLTIRDPHHFFLTTVRARRGDRLALAFGGALSRVAVAP